MIHPTLTIQRWIPPIVITIMLFTLVVYFKLYGIHFEWDDANYLYRGLYHANQISEIGDLLFLRLPYSLFFESPKPPFLTGWISTWFLLFGKENFEIVIIFSTIIPYVLLSFLVYFVSSIIWTRTSGILSLLFFWSSPIGMKFSTLVLTEIWTSFWLLATLISLSAAIIKGKLYLYLICGFSLGLLMLSKHSFSIFLFGPLGVTILIWLRSRRIGPTFPFVASSAVLVGAMITGGWWYVRNVEAALAHATYTANALLPATPRFLRPTEIAWEFLGPAGISVIILLTTIAVIRRKILLEKGSFAADERQVTFALLAISSIVVSILLFLIPKFYEVRYVMPTLPLVSIIVGGAYGILRTHITAPMRAAVFALAVVAALFSIGHKIATGGDSQVAWKTDELLDSTLQKYHIKSICNFGNMPDWNIYHLRFFIEMIGGRERGRTIVDFSELVDLGLAKLENGCDLVFMVNFDETKYRDDKFLTKLNLAVPDAMRFLTLNVKYRQLPVDSSTYKFYISEAVLKRRL